MKTDDTRRGSWYEQKMIPAANGKEYGPYWYLRRRDGAHTRSIYIGKRLRLIGDTRAAADIRPLDIEAATDEHQSQRGQTNMYSYEHRDDATHPWKCNVGGYVFADEDRARTFCEMWNDHHAAMATIADIPARISRQEYEAACTEHGCTPLTDADCCGYGVTYGEFKPWLNSDGSRGGNSPQQCIAMALAGKRQRAIRDEEKARPKPARQPAPMKMCACGHAVPVSQAMTASLGSSCPDCYDRMSN